jgi:hypothetical protein
MGDSRRFSFLVLDDYQKFVDHVDGLEDQNAVTIKVTDNAIDEKFNVWLPVFESADSSPQGLLLWILHYVEQLDTCGHTSPWEAAL